MKQQFLMGIDGGSQSSKVVIYDLLGNIICRGTQVLEPMHMPSVGVVEHPDDDLFDSIIVAMKQALSLFPGDVKQIIGIGLCTIRCCRCVLDKNGRLVSPVMSWMDTRISLPYQHTNDDVAYVTTTSGYLMARLTGSFTDTIANYQGQWPIDVANFQWYNNKEAFDQYNIKKQMLFELQKPGEIGGYITTEISQLTGLLVGTPVVHTANDKAVEALGAGVKEADTALVSLGTYIAAMTIGQKYTAEATQYWTNFACVPDRYLYESGGIRRGMWTVSWFKSLLGDDVIQKAKLAGCNPEDYLNKLAENVHAGSDGLLCILDWLAPTDQLYRKGMFIGFDGRHGQGHMYRSILEAIALTMKTNVDAMYNELEIDLKQLIISGGGSNSDVMMQIFADVFNRPVVRNKVNGCASLGSVICAAVALDIYPDFDTAMDKMIVHCRTFTPIPDNAITYEKMHEIYVNVSEKTDDILKETYKIFN
ncbi:MAG: FGGY-family carbohydrate kinase [Culicoidibacterales bacterium]